MAKEKEPHWKELVTTYLHFCSNKFSEEVKFDGAAPRELKSIVGFLKENNESNNEWSKDISCKKLHVFLNFSWVNESVAKSAKWFLILANKHKEETLEQIKIYKQNKIKSHD